MTSESLDKSTQCLGHRAYLVYPASGRTVADLCPVERTCFTFVHIIRGDPGSSSVFRTFQARVMEDPSQLSRVMPYGAEGAAGEHRTTVLAYCGIGTVHAFDVELVTSSLGRNKCIITTL